MSRHSLFENCDDQLSESDIRGYLDEGRLFLAKHAREKGSYTDALKLLNQVHTAEASFQTALVYLLVRYVWLGVACYGYQSFKMIFNN